MLRISSCKLLFLLLSFIVCLLFISGTIFAQEGSDNDILKTIKRGANVEDKITKALNNGFSFFLYVIIPLVGVGVMAWTGVEWAKGKPDGMERFIKAVIGVAVAAGSMYIVAWVFNLF